MGTSERAFVLHSIQDALRDSPQVPLPPEISFEEPSASPETLADQFCAELRALGGEATVVPDTKACARAIEAYLKTLGARRVAAQSSPIPVSLGDAFRGLEVAPANDLSSTDLERCDASIVEAWALVADTGSAILLASSYEERLLPYLQRVCVIVAPLSRLHATLDAGALASIATATRQRERGEAVIVTGPSRTADIEKVLVLGAHGPAHLAVFLIRDVS